MGKFKNSLFEYEPSSVNYSSLDLVSMQVQETSYRLNDLIDRLDGKTDRVKYYDETVTLTELEMIVSELKRIKRILE